VGGLSSCGGDPSLNECCVMFQRIRGGDGGDGRISGWWWVA
jgi:hypothetical protein